MKTATRNATSNAHIVHFGDIVRHVKVDVDAETSGLERYVAGEHMDTDDVQIRRWGVIGTGYLGPAFHRKFAPGQVLYGSRRTYLRKVAVADFEGICANTTFVLESKDSNFDARLLPFLMLSARFTEHSIRVSKGSVNPYVNFKDIADFQFCLPPFSEQQRIADLLTGAFATECAYRHSINCIEELRREALREIEAEGTELTVGDLIEDGTIEAPQDGNHGELHPKASDYVPNGIPFVMAKDLQNGLVDLAGCKFITEELARSLRIGFAQSGDVLLTHKGTVGEVALVPALGTPFIMLTPQVTYYRVLKPEVLNPEFLLYVMQSPGFKERLLRSASQSTRDYIGIVAQRNLRLRIPSQSTQTASVARMKEIDRVTHDVVTHIEKVKQLRKSLTDHFFSQHDQIGGESK
jgi:type I restriction enzyme S subunit